MLSNVFLKTLYDLRGSLLTWSLIFFLMSLMMLAFWPSIENSSADYENMIESFPDALLDMFGGEVDLNTLHGYLALELFGMFYPFMVLGFSVYYGARLLAGEEDDGTLDVLLATPVARWRVYLDKFLALVVYTLAVMAATYLGLVLGAILVGAGDELHLGKTLAAILQLGLLGLFFSGLAMALTATRRARGMALGIALGLAAGTYLLFTLSDAANIPEALTWFSPWYYYDGVTVIRQGLTIGHSAVLVGVTVALAAAGMVAFQRRDVGT